MTSSARTTPKATRAPPDSPDGAVLTDALPPAAAAVLERATGDGGGVTAAALAAALGAAGERDADGSPPLVVEAGPNPYRGLAAFRETDADVFFGREALTEQLVGAIARRRAVAVVGPSGSGKSSVVRAGVLPRLRAEPCFDALGKSLADRLGLDDDARFRVPVQ